MWGEEGVGVGWGGGAGRGANTESFILTHSSCTTSMGGLRKLSAVSINNGERFVPGTPVSINSSSAHDLARYHTRNLPNKLNEEYFRFPRSILDIFVPTPRP